jgi:hypothetical protein
MEQALPEVSLLLISFWIEFWYVTVVPKYFNCDAFSNYLFPIFMRRFSLAFWWRGGNKYLVLSTSISRPTSLLASVKADVNYIDLKDVAT